MSIEKEGKHYVAEGEGLRAEGKTHLEALTNLLREIVSMRALFNQFNLYY